MTSVMVIIVVAESLTGVDITFIAIAKVMAI
jgi:hypothetical protein